MSHKLTVRNEEMRRLRVVQGWTLRMLAAKYSMSEARAGQITNAAAGYNIGQTEHQDKRKRRKDSGRGKYVP